MKLLGEVIGMYSGLPIIVIGGGPSAPAALEALRDTYKIEPAAVISANEHGFKQSIYPVTHSLCCDPNHGVTRQNMELVLRKYGKPIIGPHHFADIRLPDWRLAANSGLTALAIGVYLGGAPVIAVGIDCYRAADPLAGTYFYDAKAKSNSTTKHASNFDRQFQSLSQYVGSSAPIRFLGGNSMGYFPPFQPGEPLAPALPEKAKYYRAMPKIILQVRPHGRVSFVLAMLEPGRLFPASPLEARGLVNSKHAKVIETHPAPDGSQQPLPAELIRVPVGYIPGNEHA